MKFRTNGIRISDYKFSREDIKVLRDDWKDQVENIGNYPQTFEGKGIVLTAGGLRYTTCAWIAINMIRRLGCKLPIELWYSGNELSKEVIMKMQSLEVDCMNILDLESKHFKGYMLKPLAIIKSKFKEVLFLDADNNCVKDPTDLFGLKEFRDHGSVFWPDYWHTSKNNSIWAITNCKRFDLPEQESGQILIDKERCWEALNLCLHFNALSPYYYKILLGDKDTFKFAWLALNTPFYMIDTPPGSCGYIKNNRFYGTTMVQHNPQGEICFLHRNLLKWDITKNGEFVWNKIIRFLPNAIERKYYFGYSNGHPYMHLSGDIEELDFKAIFDNYECICHEFLRSWRSSALFKRFQEYSYFAKHRYFNGETFSLGPS